MNFNTVTGALVLMVIVAAICFVAGYFVGILTERIHKIDGLQRQRPYDWANDQQLFEE